MKFQRKSTKFILAKLVAATLALTPFAQADVSYVAVSQIVEHPALDACRDGLLQGLKDAGYVDGQNLKFEFRTAQGNPAIAAQIASEFVGDNADVLVGIATPTAQALANATQEIPVVFSAVTDPVGAKLLKSMASPDGNVTGLSDLSPVAQHIADMKKIIPSLKTIGIVYNAGEENSNSLVRLLKEEAGKQNLQVAEATVNRTADVGSATEAIADEVDIFYAITDNTVASAIAAMIKAANEAKTPVFAAETSYVDAGAVAGVGFDYYQIGYQTAEYVVKILQGSQPSQLPARVAKGTNIVINPAAASALGVTLPSYLVTNATRTVE